MIRSLLAIGLLAVRFSACITPPQMVRYVDYRGEPDMALEVSKAILDSLDYEVEWFTPEGRIVVTKPQDVRQDIRQYQYAVVIHIDDVIEIILIARRSIFKRGSEWSLGGKEQILHEEQDRIPYDLQQKIYFPILDAYKEIGWFEFDRESGKHRKRI